MIHKSFLLSGLDVMFLKNSDGKSAVAASAREICRDVVSNATSLIKIDQHLLDLYIRSKSSRPERLGSQDFMTGFYGGESYAVNTFV